MKKSHLLSILFSFVTLLAVTSANAATWPTTNGRVLTQAGAPVCAMVLTNGQHMFSCGGIGNYNMNVPLDTNGLITVQVFAAGFAPYKQTLTAGQAVGYNTYMDRDTSGRAFTITKNEFPSQRLGWVLVSGNIDHNGTPLCAMILINGQRMFSCNNNLGRYSLEVPLDQNGNVTLQAFAAGFMPFRTTFLSNYPDTGDLFSLASLQTSAPGIVYATQITGSDSDGKYFRGSLSIANRSKEMLNGVLVTPRDAIFNITDSSSSFTVTSTATGYTDTSGELISIITHTTGLVCTPISSGRMPNSVKIGDFGILPTLSCNDNTTQARSWRTEDAGNGNIIVINNSTSRNRFNDIVTIADLTYTLNGGGRVIALKSVTRLIQENYAITLRSN